MKMTFLYMSAIVFPMAIWFYLCAEQDVRLHKISWRKAMVETGKDFGQMLVILTLFGVMLWGIAGLITKYFL